MNDKSDGLEPTKGSLVSVQFLLLTGLFAVGIIAGPWIMFQVMLRQDHAIVEHPDAVTVTATDTPQVQSAAATDSGGGGERGGGGGQGGGRQFNPEEFFATRDEDNNGKLEGEEISERMQGRLEQIDTDKDGAVSKEEFLAGMRNRGGAGGRRGGQADGQQARPEQPEFHDSEESNDEDGETAAKKNL